MAEEQRVSVWRHPRRLGFILFNLVALKALVSWLGWRSEPVEPGAAGVLDAMLVNTGMTVLIIVWVGMWVAWGVFLYLRHRRHPS